MRLCCLLFAFVFAVSCTTARPPAVNVVDDDVPFTLPPASSRSSTDLDPIRKAIGAKTIVMLGGSIHFAGEFSRARDLLVRNLHEGGDFNLLLLEGSPVDYWIAEEEYFSGNKDVLSSSDFQKNALPPLWQTEEIRSVVDYALGSQLGAGSSDLYLSSYGVQIGQGRRFTRGRNVFETLIGLLKTRDKRITGDEERAILLLEGLVSCEQGEFPSSEEQYSQAEQGIGALSGVVARSIKPANDLHEKTLALLPRMVGYSLEFCREARESDRDNSEIRDDWSSRQFIELFSTLNQKTLIWADSANIRQSAREGQRMPFGAYVRGALPEEVFAIHFTAGTGHAIAFTDARGEEIRPIETALLPLDKVSLEAKLSRLSATDFFVTSIGLPSEFGMTETTRAEPGGFVTIRPRKDFDGYYYVAEITAPGQK
ncbi:MAG TPA: erythromycin esterase family protein [Terriglobia bacterium]|nr:erythromycin esterase family protein [Terriglobia bacterium]